MRQNHYQKVAVFGIGAVGNAVAYGLVNQGLCNEVLLVNRNKDKAMGVALDLRQSMEYMGRNVKVWAGDPSECGDAEVVIFCLGGNPKSHERNDILECSCQMVRPMVEQLMASGFDGYIIVVTNPVDAMAHYIWRISGLPASHVIGTGTALDSARLKCFLSAITHVDPRSIMACSMGEHGNSQFIPWSDCYIAGKRVMEMVTENPERFDLSQKDLAAASLSDRLLDKVKLAGWKIFEYTGHTCYGVASAAIGIARSILHDEHSVIPCSVLLDGQYGYHDIFASTPCTISGEGVQDIFELSLTEEEKQQFDKSAEVLKISVEISKKF